MDEGDVYFVTRNAEVVRDNRRPGLASQQSPGYFPAAVPAPSRVSYAAPATYAGPAMLAPTGAVYSQGYVASQQPAYLPPPPWGWGQPGTLGWLKPGAPPVVACASCRARLLEGETVLLLAGSLNLTDIVHAQDTKYGVFGWYWLRLFPMLIIFFISALAETNRPPFDLVEAESELVAGFMVEYSATPYVLFMLAEYVAIVTMCAMMTILFAGGWLPPFDIAPFNWIPGVIWFVLKVCFFFFFFAMVKALVPRYRYDQLMRLGWKVFLPLSLAAVVIVAGVLKLVAH